MNTPILANSDETSVAPACLASPRPWHIEQNGSSPLQIRSGSLLLATIREGNTQSQPFDNARLIVEAVNQHALLLGRVKDLEGAVKLALSLIEHNWPAPSQMIYEKRVLSRSLLNSPHAT